MKPIDVPMVYRKLKGDFRSPGSEPLRRPLLRLRPELIFPLWS